MFIKHLIECKEIIPVEGNSNYTKQTKETFMKIARSFVSSSDFSASADILKKEKMIYLFLKRACLADHFLLDLDRILLVSNLSEYFSIKLDYLINQNGSEFEFRPFVFSSLHNEIFQFTLKILMNLKIYYIMQYKY